MMEFFKERLGVERANQILQESVGKTYEELLDERDELAARVEELENEIKQLREELAESQECEDPGLRAHKKFSKVVTDIFDDREVKRSMYAAMAEREAREGIPMEELEGQDGSTKSIN